MWDLNYQNLFKYAGLDIDKWVQHIYLSLQNFWWVIMHMTNSYINYIFIVLCSVFKTWSAVSLSYFHIFRKNYFAISFENFLSFLDLWCNFIQMFILSRYMLAEGLGLSGIVSILFTGIVSGCTFFYCITAYYTLKLCYRNIGFSF